ncbi:MAG: hypothetical protein V4819_03500 [Verrucomicrobiota bacterium]
MSNEHRWDELADLVGTAYHELELYIATRDLRLAVAKPFEREAIFEEGTLRVRAVADAMETLKQYDLKNLTASQGAAPNED